MKYRIKYTLAITISVFTAITAMSQPRIVENVKKHISADPLTISGSLGGSLQASYNNKDIYSGSSPFAVTAYANFNVGIYGFNIPININLLNVSATQFSFPHPQLSINMTPQWRNWRFHIGTSSMHFSNYTYSGLSFTGLGAEYQGKVLRAAAFYGMMQPATRFQEQDNRSAIQYYADSLLGLNVQETELPQFKRIGYGGKIGVGSSRNFIDLSLFKAKDDLASLPLTWRNANGDSTYRDSVILAKENLDVGLAGRFSLGSWFSLSANVGMSVFSDDLTSMAINRKSLSILGVDSNSASVNKVMKIIDKIAWLYEPRFSSQVRFAGDAAANFNFRKVSATFTYRFVQPDYTSLGANKFSQNAQGFGGNVNLNMLKGKSFLGLTGYLQKDNMDGKQMYTNQVGTFSATMTNNFSDHLNMALSYNAVKQDQFDGSMVVPDSVRLNQLVHTVSLSPSYSFTAGGNDHTISLNFNTVQNQNLNKLSKNSSEVNTFTAGLNYDVSIEPIRLTVGGNYDYSSSSASFNSYTSHSFGASANYVVTKSEKMNLKLNYSMSIGFNNNVEGESESGIYDPDDPESTPTTNNISFSNRLGATFSYNKQHSAQFYLSTSNFSENIVIGQKISTSFDLRFNIAYNYSFAKRVIKNKKNDDAEQEGALR